MESSLAKIMHHQFTAQEVLHQLQDFSTDKCDEEDSELDLNGEISDENSDGKEAGDGNCLGFDS